MSKHHKKDYYDKDGNLFIKPYRQKDLAAIFDINAQTLKRWMSKYPEELGHKEGNYYSITQVKFCIEKFGLPQKIAAVIAINSMQNAA